MLFFKFHVILSPTPGCCSKSQLKLSINYLTKYHPNIKDPERGRLLKQAKVAPRNYIPCQTKLMPSLSRPVPCEHLSTPLIAGTRQGISTHPSVISNLIPSHTNVNSQFPSDNPQLALFKHYLMSLDGNLKGETAAEAITRNVSKYLKHCNSERVLWKYIEDRAQLLRQVKYQKLSQRCH